MNNVKPHSHPEPDEIPYSKVYSEKNSVQEYLHDYQPNRYIIVKGSISAHCCFEYSIVDTKGGYWGSDLEGCNGYWKEDIAEVFYLEDAVKICTSLNKTNTTLNEE